MSRVGSLYDDLFSFENRWFWKKKFTKNTSYPVHKPFSKPFFLPNGTNVNDVNEWVLKTFNFDENSFFLDAGCGNGQSSFLIHDTFKSSGIGISLSSKEIKLAQLIANQKGVSDKLHFRENSFEDVFNQSFDFIIAIESMKHSLALKASINNLVKHLKPNGKLIIVDDLFIDDHSNISSSLIADFKDYWAVEQLYSSSDFSDLSDQVNLKLVSSVNFTDNIPSHSVAFINLKLFGLRLTNIFTFSKYKKRILKVFIGGFIQDKLYRKGVLEYRGLVFKKMDNV
jgi:SAM-dependent methyltransferase